MDQKGYRICTFNKGISKNMINMTMRIYQLDRMQCMLMDFTGQMLLFFTVFTSRINDNTRPRVVINEISVYLEGIININPDLKHH